MAQRQPEGVSDPNASQNAGSYSDASRAGGRTTGRTDEAIGTQSWQGQSGQTGLSGQAESTRGSYYRSAIDRASQRANPSWNAQERSWGQDRLAGQPDRSGGLQDRTWDAPSRGGGQRERSWAQQERSYGTQDRSYRPPERTQGQQDRSWNAPSDRYATQGGYGGSQTAEYGDDWRRGDIREGRERAWGSSDDASIRQDHARVERDLSFGGERSLGRWEREPYTAGEVMTRSVKAVTRDSSLRDAAQVMKDENCGIVPVVDQSMRLLGVLTDRDMVIRGFSQDRVPSQLKVAEVMTDDVECVTADEPLTEVIALMGRKQIRRVPVVDRDDRLAGIISLGDVANRADYDQDLQAALEKISARRSFWSRLFG